MVQGGRVVRGNHGASGICTECAPSPQRRHWLCVRHILQLGTYSLITSHEVLEAGTRNEIECTRIILAFVYCVRFYAYDRCNGPSPAVTSVVYSLYIITAVTGFPRPRYIRVIVWSTTCRPMNSLSTYLVNRYPLSGVGYYRPTISHNTVIRFQKIVLTFPT